MKRFKTAIIALSVICGVAFAQSAAVASQKQPTKTEQSVQKKADTQSTSAVHKKHASKKHHAAKKDAKQMKTKSDANGNSGK